MAQLQLHTGIVDSPLLRRHIEENVAEIETTLPEGADVSIHLRKNSKREFCADLHARLMGRILVVKAHDANLFLAINRARRHLLRQIAAVRQQHRERRRNRAARHVIPVFGLPHLVPVES